MSKVDEKSVLRAILALFILAGSLYALLTPVFEMSDELWHYPMIQHLGNGNPLPVQVYDPDLAGPWKQEASQPPLYYYLGAALTFWIDTSDMQTVRQLNPHVSNGIITADGNTNLAVHNNPDLNPLRGTLLAVRIVRLVSVFLGAWTVYFTYLIGKELAPNRPEIGMLAAVLAGFTPMFLFISGAVNNDNLALPLASLGLLLLIRAVGGRSGERGAGSDIAAERSTVNSQQLTVNGQRGETKPKTEYRKPNHRLLVTDPWSLITVGAVIGLAVLTKQGTIGLLPLAWGTFFILGWLGVRHRFLDSETDWAIGLRLLLLALGRSLVSFVLMFLPVLLIAGWWYWRNIVLYGDLLGWSAFEAVLGVRETPASVAQLWDERWGFMLSYWGLFGGVNVPMSTWIYYLLNGLLILAIPGGIVYGWQVLGQLFSQSGWDESDRSLFQKSVAFLLDGVVRFFPLVVSLLFSFAIVYGLVQWARNTWSSQGRLVFTAISALNLLFALGLIGWMKPGRLPQRTAAWLGAGMILLGLLAPLLFIRPAYQPDRYAYLRGADGAINQQFEDVVFSDYMRLNAAAYSQAALAAGGEPGCFAGLGNGRHQRSELVSFCASC